MTVAYVLDDVFVNHRPPAGHPERPERIVAVREALAEAGLAERGTLLPVRAARDEEVGRVHAPGYWQDLLREVPGRAGFLDGDTYYSPGTWEAALAAAAASVDVTCAVLSGEFSRGLAVVRPPGHHAEADRAMGFCLLNNVAVAAAAARDAGATRVAIVDWDVHHGNGTQHIFEEDPSVLYVSLHQYPHYPGTGAPDEIGRGAGLGATVNVALPAGCGDAEYAAATDEIVVPELARFAPDIILISAGFDAHVDDPLGGMQVTRAGYRRMAAALRHVADEVAGGRLVCVLEGGYDLGGLGGGMVAALEAMEAADPARPSAAAAAVAPAARLAIDNTGRALRAAREGAAR